MSQDFKQSENSDQEESFTVFRFQHKLGNGIKNQIKAYRCNWNALHHGWICPKNREDQIQMVLEKAQLIYTMQSVLLPKGMISSNSKIAGLQARLEILEIEFDKESKKLLMDVFQYDPSLRPEDFTYPPLEENMSTEQFTKENECHLRWTALQNKREEIKKIRDELTHLDADPDEKVFDSDAPLIIADALIEEQFLINGCRTLQYCADQFWRWDGTKYVELTKDALRQTIYLFLRDAKAISKGMIEDFNPDKFKVNHVIDALQGICYHKCFPASGAIWLDGRSSPNPKHLISFRNGLLNFMDWLDNPDVSLLSHTPLFFTVNSLDFEYSQGSEPKEWVSFLNSIWPDDEESQQTLQETAGYYLTQITKFHKILLMIGPPRSGKGTIGRILFDLLGESNVAGPTLSSLGGEFGLQQLLNKTLAIISDARLNGRAPNNVIIERLLSISGEDPLTINRKFLSPLTTKLATRIMIMSNELPDLRDASNALSKRYIVLTLKKSWFGKEDTELLSRLQNELPGILLWALKGLSRLLERGKFIQPQASAQTIEDLETMTSPIRAFVSERCELRIDAKIPIPELFQSWKDWCFLTGYSQSGNIQSFGKSLRAAFPEIEGKRPQDQFTRERYYLGISLRSSSDASADVRGHNGEEYD